MLGSFLIFLREGVEGSMICAILLTYLAAGGRRDLFRWVVGGALLAAGLSALAGTGLYLTIRTAFVGSTAQTWVETGTFVVAVGVLTYMTFWMKGTRAAWWARCAPAHTRRSAAAQDLRSGRLPSSPWGARRWRRRSSSSPSR